MNDSPYQTKDIQYAFGLDEQDRLVHISSINKKQEFKCPGCGQELIPAIGQKNAHHFRHVNKICGYESYLHKTAKLAFFNVFQEKKGNGTPLFIHLDTKIICRSRKLEISGMLECESSCTEAFDLLKLFNQAKLEEYDKDSGFKPDILLLHDGVGHKCYVEIFVTHACSEEKIASKIPIIEFYIKSEEDIKRILDGEYESSDHVSFFNFKPKPKLSKVCHEKCKIAGSKLERWNVASNGRLRKETVVFWELNESELNEINVWPVSVDNKRFEQLVKLTRASAEKRFFYNCIICQFAQGWNDGVVNCEIKGDVHYMNAKECMHYKCNYV